MKKMIMMMAMMLTIVASSNAMNSRRASVEARQMTDRMIRELGLSHRQVDKVYDINYQYLRQVGTRDEFRAGDHRMHQLGRVLTSEQMHRLVAINTHHDARHAHNASWRRPAPAPTHRPSHGRH